MRKAVLVAILVFSPLAVFADSQTCPQPSATLSTIPGNLTAPCAPAFDFTTVNMTVIDNTSSNGSGAGTGKVVESISFTRPIDPTSIALFNACANGNHLQSGSVRVNASVLVKLTDVVVTQATLAGSGDNASESITLNFRKSELIYGSGGGKIISSYMGTARAAGAMAMMTGGGGGGEISHFEITAHPGSVSGSVQLKQQPVRAAVASKTMATAKSAGLGDGSIELRSRTGAPLAQFGFTGGTLLNNRIQFNFAKMNVRYTQAH